MGPLGFGSQIGSFGWVFVVAAITGLIAKENVIATFGTLAGCITAGFVADEALEGIDAVASRLKFILDKYACYKEKLGGVDNGGGLSIGHNQND